MDKSTLQKRVDRFVQRELMTMQSFVELFDTFRCFGKVVVFGGLVRDLALGHARAFSSDVDLVLKDVPFHVLERYASRHGAQLNSFGGFRLQLGRWGFDVWSFDTTWAFTNGLVRGRDIVDLLRTTFFNWDAALFDLEVRELIAGPSYFGDLENHRLAINLRNTPNELGAAVRTLRLMSQNEVVLMPDLADFLHRQILRHGIHEIAGVDSKRRGRRRLTRNFVGSVAVALQHHQAEQPSTPFAFVGFQRQLPLEKTQS